jgi:hypothetical protein
MMRALRIGVVATFVSLLLISCSGSANSDDVGYVVMMPYESEEMGFRSVVPVSWEEVEGAQFMRRDSPFDETTLIQVVIPDMSMAEAKVYAASQLNLDVLPDSNGTYTSTRLTWDLYEFEPPLSEIVKMKMQLALSEDDGVIYVVAMAALASDYEAEAPFHETVFNSAVHGLTPLE